MKLHKRTLSKGFWMCGWVQAMQSMAFYLTRSILLIFVTTAVAEGGLGMTSASGAVLQADLMSFSYLGAMVGGLLVDRFIGARYSTPIGMFIAGLGYYVGSAATDSKGLYLMIILVCFGLTLFKTTPMIGRLVEPKQMDEAFSVSYSLTNLGGLLGPLLAGFLYKDFFARNGVLGFAPCFRLAAVVMFCGTALFLFGTRFMGDVGKLPFLKTKTKEELEREKSLEKSASENSLVYTAAEKKRIGAIIMLSAFSVVFMIFYDLAFLPVYYHWSEAMNWVVGGYEIPLTWTESLDGVFCIILGNLMAAFWAKLAARPQGDISIYKKLAIALLLLGGGYVYNALIEILRGDSRPSALYLVVFLLLLTMGEMFFAPMGYSFISKYSPSRCLGLMMGVWGAASFVAAKLYGYLYNFAFGGRFPFAYACIAVAVIAAICALVLFALDQKLSALVEQE